MSTNEAGVKGRALASSIEELVEGASSRQPFRTGDAKSGSVFEWVVIDGERYVLKQMDVARDWIMRTIGDIGCWPVVIWQHGLVDTLSPWVDSTIAGGFLDRSVLGKGALLLRDVSDHLVPEGDTLLAPDTHLRFLDHMAACHAAMWGWSDTIGLLGAGSRYLFFSDAALEYETTRPEPAVVPGVAADGWARFREVARPGVVEVIEQLRRDPSPLVDALALTPRTLLPGDWKMGNLGAAPDGRTIFLDWAYPGEGWACQDLAWYLALNRSRFALSKEDSIEAYRASLEAHGIDTAVWWDRQLSLSLLGGLVWFGWEKALGDEAELAWWQDRVGEGARYL